MKCPACQYKLALEGIVVQRAECRPAASENYMKLKSFYSYKLGDELTESSLVEKDLRILVDEELDVSQQSALTAPKACCPGVVKICFALECHVPVLVVHSVMDVNTQLCHVLRLQIEESSKPVRLSQQLDKAVTTNYKPVANHQYNIEYEKKKKEDGKRARADKQQVLDMLFSAFEKHQYYNIKDLVDITKQPVIYLKEILREIGIYNVKGTHKNTWELKPEYRHYQGEEKSD
ncbi:hypothetical protein WISP_14442 [Willisornis vidua]|uniref:TFIIF beta subunit HTH domain-containing protein n=1 Tax=Willisornis vidua TaxID=1566151 RepID=A0ABQ9DW08_9PASS|nr:hypothetical protein WISP_14442 [Willisornis vidua]